MKLSRLGISYWYIHGTGRDRIRRPVHLLYEELTGVRLLPVTKRSEAERYAAEIFQLLNNPQTHPQGVRLDKVIPEYLDHCLAHHQRPRTILQKQRLFAQLTDRGFESLNQFTPRAIESWLDSLPVSGASKNRYLSALSGLLRFARRAGYIRTLPTLEIDRYRESRTRTVHVFTRAEIDRLKFEISKLSPNWSPLAAIIELAYQTGMRRSEISYLWRTGWKHIDRVRRLVQFPPGLTKNYKSMPVPLNAAAFAAITDLLRGHPRTGAPSACGGSFSLWTPDTITHRFRTLCRQLHLRAVFHDLRHTFASRVDSAGIRPLSKTKSALMQHSDPYVAERTYTHPDLEHMRAVVDSLPD